MNAAVSDKAYEAEALAYLRVFYPLEDTITAETGKQPLFRIDVSASTIEVAYFDVHNTAHTRILDSKDAAEFGRLDGKAKTVKGKLFMKQLMYDLCSEITGIIPPWGVLMGIRPTKLAFKLLSESGDYDIVLETLIDTYRLSEEKARLLVEVVQREQPFMTVEQPKHSIYIGIPFCPSRCSYCSFTAYDKERFQEAYLAYTDVLIQEMRAFENQFKAIRSIYIGGGTPTSLTDNDFDKLMCSVRELLGEQDVEFTVEAGRVDSISEAKLNSMKLYGVNRISINPQTSHDRTLERIGRRHTFADVEKVFGRARELGFKHINMDLILGLPEETPEDVKETMNRITALRPESITIHTMALKKGTQLTEHRKKYLTVMADRISQMLQISSKSMSASGYHGYYLYRQKNMVGNFENVGYCLEDMESIYNIHTMEEKESIIAFGSGAISKRVSGKKVSRLDQTRDVKQYVSDIDRVIERKRLFFS